MIMGAVELIVIGLYSAGGPACTAAPREARDDDTVVARNGSRCGPARAGLGRVRSSCILIGVVGAVVVAPSARNGSAAGCRRMDSRWYGTTWREFDLGSVLTVTTGVAANGGGGDLAAP